MLAPLRAHGAVNVVADIETAVDATHLARIAQAAYDVEAITADHAALLGLLALASPPPTGGRGYRDVLHLFVERVERMSDREGPRFAIARRRVLAKLLREEGAPEFARREDGYLADPSPGVSARDYLQAALEARAIVVPDGHRVIVEGEDDEDGCWLRCSVERAPRRAQLSWGWGAVKNIPTSDGDAAPIDALRDLLTWAVEDLNSLLASDEQSTPPHPPSRSIRRALRRTLDWRAVRLGGGRARNARTRATR